MADLTAMLQAAAGAVGGDYQISRSLRFNSADSAYLNRTPASAGNRKTWTLSFWIKRSFFNATNQHLFGATSDSYSNNFVLLTLVGGPDERLRLSSNDSVGLLYSIVTTQVFRDVSAWYHFVVAFDTTQATSSNRIKFYVNGSQITALDTTTYPTQNLDSFVNNNIEHTIGLSNGSPNGYLTEINLIDGQALTPSSFGEINADTGVWSPIRYAGTYGTNGFFLKFADNSGTTSTTLGKDSSPNGNNWTPNNFSVTAGAGNDSLVDSPTRYGTDTGAGGEVRGNYATLNPLQSAIDLSNGNISFTNGASNESAYSTIGVSSGKWFCEAIFTSTASTAILGIAREGSTTTSSYIGSNAGSYGWDANGNKYNNDSGSAYGSARSVNDVIGCALDLDAGTITFYLNGVSQGAAYSSLPSGTYFFGIASYSSSGSINFGQRPFSYTAPSGFKALVTTNLPDPTIVEGDEYFNTVLYTGTGSSLGVTGVGFQPDWVWIKERSGAADHGLYDAVRGVQKQLESNNLDAETTESTGLTAFGTDGFTVGSLAQLNTSADTYVAWNWKAGSSNVTNTDGTITSTVRANTTAGFSIVSYTGSSASTVGHGLGVAPKMIIAKQRDNVEHWVIYHVATGKDAVLLFTTSAVISSANYWGSGGVTSTVFGTGGVGAGNAQNSIIAYCFAEAEGFSKFESYTGNGSADGPFVYTGFRPAWILFKVALGLGGESWTIYDTKRGTYNVMGPTIFANLSNAEATNNSVDVLSNGFKLRSNSSALNYNTATMIFAAFAENPFKYSLAR